MGDCALGRKMMRGVVYVSMCVMIAMGVQGMESDEKELESSLKVEEKLSLRKCEVKHSNNNPLLFSVINLTSYKIKYYLKTDLKQSILLSYCNEDDINYLKPKLLYHSHLDAYPSMIKSMSSNIMECLISPKFGVGRICGAAYQLPCRISWGRIYIICPMVRSIYARDGIKAYDAEEIKVSYLDFYQFKYLFSTDASSFFYSLPIELKQYILLRTLTIAPKNLI